MDSNERREELKKILKTTFSGEPLTITRLAKILNVSTRTVHYDLDSLESELKNQGLKICKQSRKGIWLESLNGNGSATDENEYYVLSPKERRDRIIVALLEDKKHSIDELAEMTEISRNTLLTDLKNVRETLEKRGLSYGSKRGLGIWANGGEQEIRDMLIHIFAKSVYDFRQFLKTSAQEVSPQQKSFYDYAAGLPVTGVAKFFLEIMESHKILDNDESANRMICALVVQLKRLQQGHRIFQSKQVEFLSDEGEHMKNFSAEIADGLVKYHEHFAKPEEIRYIMRELLHSRIFLFPVNVEKNLPKNVNLKAIELARKFIEYAQVWLGDIYLDDDELIYNLAIHLQPAIERANFGIMLNNPLLGQIREQYESLYVFTRKAAEQISDSMGIHFSEDEIGYLTIHLGAAAERKKMRLTKKLSVLLVCGNGVGTANLLAMTLKRHLHYINITKILSTYKLIDKDLENIDLIISTVPLDIKDVAVLRVSPIMTGEETKVIENQIQYFYNKKFTSNGFGSESLKKNPTLADLMKAEVIELNFSANTWEEAVRKAGELLLSVGAITENYVEKMIDCVKRMGAYIVVCPGVAMPHARYEDGVKAVAVSFLRLDKSVVFVNEDDPHSVDMLFAFSTTDEKSHLRMLQDLWKIFNDNDALNYLRVAKSKEAVLKFIRDYN